MSSADPTSSDSDNLRRSKRKKFRLDVVAAAHGNNQKKSRRDPHGEEDDDDDYEDLELSIKTEPDDFSDVPDDDEEETVSKRRTRRSTAHWGDYQDSLDWVDQSGSFACHKCPSRYESRSSLSNHMKMHTDEKRKFACELCDFSASTLKSLTHHNNIHKRYGVVSAQTSPAIPPTTDSSVLDTSNNNSSTVSNSAPQLVVASEEPFSLEDFDAANTTPPPVLEREEVAEQGESDTPPVLQREKSTSMSPPPLEEAAVVGVRKSNRPLKPTKKGTPIPKAARTSRKIPTPPSSSASLSDVTPLPLVIPKPLLFESKSAGSLPSSMTPSSSSSVTPPQKRSPVPKKTSKPKKQIKPRARLRCRHCPYSATTITKLNKHSIGHKMKEGFLCPAKNCSFMCRKAGFLQRHYVLHKGLLPGPPKFVTRDEISEKSTKKVVVKENVEVKTKVQVKLNRRKLASRAQLKSHKPVQDSTRRCNIGDCQFQNNSITQFILHKTKNHKARTIFPQSKFLCLSCGHRASSYAALRFHKSRKHTSTSNRFHRTFYLKELVGDKYFIQYYVNGKKVEEEAEESGDDSFDSLPGSSMTMETLAQIEKKAVFCCNLCPYHAPTMNRCQRHYAKHFTNDTFKCGHCSWSSRSKEVIVAHEKLHLPPDAVVEEDTKPNIPSTSSSLTSTPEKAQNSSESPKKQETVEMFNNPETADLAESLRKWCLKEQSRRPEIHDQFTRKMIDGVKGFQCIDCPYTSKYRGDMRSHKKRHDIAQMYRCGQCTYTTNRPVSLKDHMKQHMSVNDSLKNIQSKEMIVNEGAHIGTRRGFAKDRIYCCNKCPYVAISLACLWRHHRNHRAVAKINICSNCSYSSIDQRKMEEHTIVHTALGINESVPFVKRVDQKGRPVSSLTDLNSDKMTERKNNKRKLTDDSKDVEPKAKKERKRKGSDEPFSSSDSPLPTCHPTRQLSERATRNRINYSLMAKNGSGKPTPSTSSANLEQLAGEEEEKPEESPEVSHWRIRQLLKTEFSGKAINKCPECPFKSSDAHTIEQHLYFHRGEKRPYVCSDCSYNTITPTALLQHLKLHSEGVYFDPTMKRTMKQKKGDTIPPGVKAFSCKTCSFKTMIHRNLVEHNAYHRHQLINRINVTMKRQPPKEEYQRPKMKHQFVAKNAKYCRKCTFKCVSQSNYVEHVDRHGWNQLYKCYVCDYSDNNKSVVDFHQLNHHTVRDQTLHSVHSATKLRLENGVIQKPETEAAKPTPEDFLTKSRCLLKCSCCEFYCHVAPELAFHMSVEHKNDPSLRETISYLSMGLMPPQATVKTV